MVQSTRFATAACAAVLLAACDAYDAGPERAAYLTLMGDDTLAVEWVEFGENTVDAQALVRGRQTTFADYHLELSDDGTLAAYRADVYAGGAALDYRLRLRELEELGEPVERVYARVDELTAGGLTLVKPFLRALRC